MQPGCNRTDITLRLIVSACIANRWQPAYFFGELLLQNEGKDKITAEYLEQEAGPAEGDVLKGGGK